MKVFDCRQRQIGIGVLLLGFMMSCTAEEPTPHVATATQAVVCDVMPYLTGISLTDLNKNPVTTVSPNTSYYVQTCAKVASTCVTVTGGGQIAPGASSCNDTSFSAPYTSGDTGVTYYSVVTSGSSTSLTGNVVPWDACDGAEPQFTTSFSFPGPNTCVPSKRGAGPPPPATGLLLWLRADAGITSSGGKVSTWLDQSGHGFIASMSVAARQPALVDSALNGHAVIRFGGAQSLGLSPFVSPTRFTVLVVGKNSKAAETFSMILGPGGNAPNNQLRWEDGSQALFVGTGNNLPAVTSTIGNTRVYHTLSARYDGATMNVFRDGVATSSHSFTTTGPWTLAQIGAYYSSLFMEGDVAEILMYDNALSDTDLSAATGYLRSKYNLP